MATRVLKMIAHSSQRDNFNYLALVLLSSLTSNAVMCPVVLANDWGYDGVPEVQPPKQASSPVGLRAAPPALMVPSGSNGKVTPPKRASAPPAAKTAATSAVRPAPKVVSPNEAVSASGDHIDYDKQASVCWQQLFQIAAKSPLSYEQQKRFEDYMLNKAKLGGKYQNEVRSILKFWPRVMSALKENPDLETGYVSLFHALLRIREAMPIEKINVEGEVTSDSDLITEVLGIQRTAVQGNPSLTEDAVNAYADLTCFIYEQKNPGKSVDAEDNRALLARVVSDKFREAPTEADKRAMAHFDLAWAKFRILWDNADQPTRKIMLDKLTKDGAGSTLSLAKDPVMEQVISNWPWAVKP